MMHAQRDTSLYTVLENSKLHPSRPGGFSITSPKQGSFQSAALAVLKQRDVRALDLR
jgi:hypothetical protein